MSLTNKTKSEIEEIVDNLLEELDREYKKMGPPLKRIGDIRTRLAAIEKELRRRESVEQKSEHR